ncbi:hypothetical protein ACHAWF_003084 [Thalassiosira exigua]
MVSSGPNAILARAATSSRGDENGSAWRRRPRAAVSFGDLASVLAEMTKRPSSGYVPGFPSGPSSRHSPPPPCRGRPLASILAEDDSTIADIGATLEQSWHGQASLGTTLALIITDRGDWMCFCLQFRRSSHKRIARFFCRAGKSLAQKHLLPLDEAYRGRAIFPIRDDDSIFVSLASFRDHLLGDTLKGMFDQAAHPEKLFVGVVVQNCFGLNPYPGEPGVQCRTGAQVVGKVNGRDQTKVSDAPPDRNGIEEFCMSSEKHREICNSGRIRALYVHENESLGPVVARYYASKLWGGESYYVQFDAHIHFYKGWDELYVHELKSAKSFPKAMLSSYPPGFKEDGEDNGGILGGDGGHGTLLCSCKFSPSNVESHIIRINIAGRYTEDVERPAQIPFVAAGFFFAPASFLVDVPFDPYMPWCFMGEEIMLSMRAYTHGWDVYAPRKNWIAHQYRPGRMGLPKFWGSVGRLFGQPGPGINTQLQRRAIKRAKYLVGYDEEDEDCCAREQLIEDGLELVLTDVEHYGFGEARTREAFLEWANIDVDAQECHPIKWCGDGKMRPISA